MERPMIVTDPSQYRASAVTVIARVIADKIRLSEGDARGLAEHITTELEYTGWDCFREEHPTDGGED
jgi:hypothetical protein